jgi:hypothetical protein
MTFRGRNGVMSPSGCIPPIAGRQFVLNWRKMHTRPTALCGRRAIAKKKGRLSWQPERRYCGEKDVIAMGEISRR